MIRLINTGSIADYRLFLKIKGLPRVRFCGHEAYIPDEYALSLGEHLLPADNSGYTPKEFLFDYQADVARLAIRKERFAIFMACGLGKTMCIAEFARHALTTLPSDKKALIVSPLMVTHQTASEVEKFYGSELPIEKISSSKIESWLASPGADDAPRLGITNYEAFRGNVPQGHLGALILDESSILKSAYGKYGQRLMELGRGLRYKLCATGTPAPNDRIEYAQHAVFLDRFATINSFLARYFVNRGETQNRWELKPHALKAFWRALSDWCIFVEDPGVYGWRDNCNTIPPIRVQTHHVDLTADQDEAIKELTGGIVSSPGGITKRSKLMQLAKGKYQGRELSTNKPEFIRKLIKKWVKKESTILWCRYNHEQDLMERTLRTIDPELVSIEGATKEKDRLEGIAKFQAGKARILISKPSVLGFGLNLQIATRHVFNGLWDSAEEYHQAIKRSNRVGSTKPLDVHIPLTAIEQPMTDSVMRKLARINEDIKEQELLFRENQIGGVR